MRIRTCTSLIAVVILAVPYALALAQTPAPVKPMAADAHPSFAVATIKPHDPASNRQGFDAVGDRVSIQNQSVATMMMFAYSIDKHQIVDAPDWALHDRWDIEGTNDTPGQPNLRQQQEMLQKLLADRFGLKFHHEKRALPVYFIQIAKGGPKLKPPANPDAEADQDASNHGTEQTVTITTSASMIGLHRSASSFSWTARSSTRPAFPAATTSSSATPTTRCTPAIPTRRLASSPLFRSSSG